LTSPQGRSQPTLRRLPPLLQRTVSLLGSSPSCVIKMPELPSGFGTRGRLSPVFQLAFGGELGKCDHTLHQGGELSTGISFVPHKTSSQVESQSLLLLRRNDLHTNSPLRYEIPNQHSRDCAICGPTFATSLLTPTRVIVYVTGRSRSNFDFFRLIPQPKHLLLVDCRGTQLDRIGRALGRRCRIFPRAGKRVMQGLDGLTLCCGQFRSFTSSSEDWYPCP